MEETKRETGSSLSKICPICNHILQVHFNDGCLSCSCNLRIHSFTHKEYFDKVKEIESNDKIYKK